MSVTFGINFKIAQLLGGKSYKNEFEESPIDILPFEIMYIIIEKLDDYSFSNCLHVSNKWRSIVLRIANLDKTDQRWKCIFESLHEEDTFKVKSCNLLYKELFANSLRWNLDFTYSLYKSCAVKHIKKLNIYRDNIIVVDCVGVKYYDVHTHKIRKSLNISKCIDFIERDAIVIRITQVETEMNASMVKLFLYGKRNINDEGYVVGAQIIMNYGDPGINHHNSILLSGVNQYVLENDCCYVMNAFNNVLTSYTWKDKKWNVRNLGRYYGNPDDLIYAMNALNTEVFLLIKSGQMLRYCYEKTNFQEVCRISLPLNKSVFVRMVHKYCLVIGVPADGEFRITRFRNFNFYKLECPNLSCVTQHGEMLLLGFNDGRIQLYMPRALAREDMFKRRIHISDFVSGDIDPEDLVVLSIDVFEELGQHYLFIATHSCVYQLEVKHEDETCLWDYIPEKVVCSNLYPIRIRHAL